MHNFYKYLPYSREDKMWGLHVLNAGFNRIEKKAPYPAVDHPGHHYFKWENGRVLKEYQLIYITSGEGIFQSDSVKQCRINEGSIIFLFPGEWHRFKPDSNSGWTECWVGFEGNIANNIFINKFFNKKEAVLEIGMQDDVMELLLKIIEQAKEEKTGYQPLIAGMTLHLLGLVHTIVRQRGIDTIDNTEIIINKARLIFRANIDQPVRIEKLAGELHVSYSWFRRAFKHYTGLAPNQYHLQLKIEKAKHLIADPEKSIKEIAFDLHFESPAHFSRLFKNRTGLSPGQFRLQLRKSGKPV